MLEDRTRVTLAMAMASLLKDDIWKGSSEPPCPCPDQIYLLFIISLTSLPNSSLLQLLLPYAYLSFSPPPSPCRSRDSEGRLDRRTVALEVEVASLNIGLDGYSVVSLADVKVVLVEVEVVEMGR